MTPRLEALKYILSRPSIDVEYLKHYMDGTKYVMNEHETAKQLISLARDIVEEMMLP
jgi:hypothetical protein